jgi:hypothetical protein
MDGDGEGNFGEGGLKAVGFWSIIKRIDLVEEDGSYTALF